MTIDVIGPEVSRAPWGWGTYKSETIAANHTRFSFSNYELAYNPSEGWYSAYFSVSGIDNCDPKYTWSDNFIQVSYVDDEQNTIDLSSLDNLFIMPPGDTGTCREYGSPCVCVLLGVV